MTDKLAITEPLVTVPERIDDRFSEELAAKDYARVEEALRSLEAQRKEKTRDLIDAKKLIDDGAKSLATPLEEIKSSLSSVLEAYRLTPTVQEALAKYRRWELAWKQAQKDGDVDTLNALSLAAKDFEVKASIPVEGGRVQFREGIEIIEIDESKLSATFFKKIPDEKLIKEHIDLVGSCQGVTFRRTCKPVYYQGNADLE